MSNGSDKRHRAIAIRAYHLREDGLTFRQIAELIGKKPEQVAALILLGQRLADIPIKE